MEEEERIREYVRQYGPFVHLMPVEREIWLKWLEGEGAKYAPYEYDVRVGAGVTLPEGATPMEQEIARILTQKRIDAVSRSLGTIRIFEVKPRAGLGAIGQLLGYRELYRATYKPTQKIELWLITDELQPDVQTVTKRHGIITREVGR